MQELFIWIIVVLTFLLIISIISLILVYKRLKDLDNENNRLYILLDIKDDIINNLKKIKGD